VARGVYQAAAELGLSVPERLSVFSFSVEPGYGAEFTPALSCVRLDAESLGTEAARLLLESCEQPSLAIRRSIISCELLIRESCSKPIPS
jgi:DNA-binding LacI/PurR family transcriptional regulator